MVKRFLLAAAAVVALTIAVRAQISIVTFPQGPNGAVQFNNRNQFGGTSNVVYSTSTGQLFVNRLEATTMVLNGVTYTWPALNSSGFLRNDGSGNMTWATPTAVVTDTGAAVGFWDGAVLISSPTSDVLANGDQFVLSLQGSTSVQWAINTSSITALGPSIDLPTETTGQLALSRLASGALSSTIYVSSYQALSIPNDAIISLDAAKLTGLTPGGVSVYPATATVGFPFGGTASTMTIGNVTVTTITFTTHTATDIPLYIDSDNRLNARAIRLEDDVSGVLPVANGGLGSVGVIAENALLTGTPGGTLAASIASTPSVRGLNIDGTTPLLRVQGTFTSLYLGKMPHVSSTWTQTGNVIIGNEDTAKVLGSNGGSNVIIGAGALAAGATIQNSVIVGPGALAAFTDYSSGLRPTTAVGSGAFNNISTGTGNTGFGYAVGSTLHGSSDDNTMLGDAACGNFEEGDANICIGARSGAGNGSSDYTHFGHNNIWIGQYTGGTNPATTLNRTVAIGYGAHPLTSDSFVIGPNLAEGTGFGYGNDGSYNVGIATDTPKERLHVAGDVWAESGGISAGAFTLAQILAKTPSRVGEQVTCTDCSTYVVCAASGTGVGAYTNPVNRGTVCQ